MARDNKAIMAKAREALAKKRAAGKLPPTTVPRLSRIASGELRPITVEEQRAADFVELTLRAAFTIAASPAQKVTVLPSGKYHYEDIPGTGSVQVYGPGHVKVPRDVAAQLHEMERRLDENNYRFDHGLEYVIGNNKKPITVPNGYLNASGHNIPEAITL